MANWSNPTLTSLYTDFVTEVKNRDVDLALGLDPATTSPTNVPANAIRWNSASFKYQKWDGSTWNDLSTKYIFTAVEVSGATVPTNGMYLSTTNTLNFSTASTASRLTIDGSGNVNIDSGTFYVDAVNNRVGVGTTGPARALDVVGSIQLPSNNALYINGSSNYLYADTTATELTSATQIKLGTNGDLRATLDASGNLGLGVVPSAWSGYRALQIGAYLNLSYNAGFSVFGNNAYNNGTNWIYRNTDAATDYYQYNGTHVWRTAPSGTAGNAITFTQAMTLDASGNLLVGTSSARTNFFNGGFGAALQVEGTTNTAKTLSVFGNTGDQFSGGIVVLGASRGTSAGSNTIVQSGDELGVLSFQGSDGTEPVDAARITAFVDGTPGANDMPGRLVFSTTADGAASPTPRMQINNLGYMQGTVNGLSAGRIPAKQYYRLDSAFAGTNGTAAQSIYGVGVTLVGSTVYEFEAIYAFSRSTGSTSHTMSFLFGGTATINNIFYTGVGPGDGILPPLSTYDGGPASFVATSAGASVATAAMTIGTGIFYIVKGTVSINAGGTFIPQYQLSAAPGGAYSTYAGAYFSIWPLAASGSAVNIGSWA